MTGDIKRNIDYLDRFLRAIALHASTTCVQDGEKYTVTDSVLLRAKRFEQYIRTGQ